MASACCRVVLYHDEVVVEQDRCDEDKHSEGIAAVPVPLGSLALHVVDGGSTAQEIRDKICGGHRHDEGDVPGGPVASQSSNSAAIGTFPAAA